MFMLYHYYNVLNANKFTSKVTAYGGADHDTFGIC